MKIFFWCQFFKTIQALHNCKICSPKRFLSLKSKQVSWNWWKTKCGQLKMTPGNRTGTQTKTAIYSVIYFFFFFFFGGPWSESLLLPESELLEDEEEEEEEDEEELSSSLSLLLSLLSEEELEESLLSDDESLEEPSESLLLSLESLTFFLIFFSLEPSLPGPVMLRGLFSLSFSFFFISAVRVGLCTYFLFPVHS